MRLISHSGRTRSFYLSKLIASVTGRGDRSGEREPCTSYRLFGELCAGSSRRVTGLSCITCAAPDRNGSSDTDRSARTTFHDFLVRCSFESSHNRDDRVLTLGPSRPGEFHPEPLTD